jgi:hypothetical protein
LQRQYTGGGRQGFVKIMRVKTVRSCVSNTSFQHIGQLVSVRMRVGRHVVVKDMVGMGMVVAMVMPMTRSMLMRENMMCMKNTSLAD